MSSRKKPVVYTRNTLDGLRFGTFELTDRTKRFIDGVRLDGIESADPQDVARIRFDLEVALKAICVIEAKINEPKVAQAA